MAEGTLEAKLAGMRKGAAERMPAEVQTMAADLVAELEKTTVANALKPGDAAPDFTLTTAGSGESVTLSEALKSGPVVLSFYRGQW